MLVNAKGTVIQVDKYTVSFWNTSQFVRILLLGFTQQHTYFQSAAKGKARRAAETDDVEMMCNRFIGYAGIIGIIIVFDVIKAIADSKINIKNKLVAEYPLFAEFHHQGAIRYSPVFF